MPALMARTCGICPVSHLVAAAKACDEILAVRIPEAAVKLRRIMNFAQIIQSHALSFFHLSSPDLVLGFDAPVGSRNILGLAASHPELAKDGIFLRKLGQQIIEMLGGRRVHPAWIVPGGVNKPLDPRIREDILARIPGGIEVIQRTLEWYKKAYVQYAEEIEHFANFPSLFLALVSGDGYLEHYDGTMRVVDSRRKIIDDGIKAPDYQEYLAEAVEPFSYLKSPYYKIMGYPEGIYRVGPLARLNVAERCGMPLAAFELFAFHKLSKGAVLSSFHYHYARLIEILYGLERIEQLLNEPDILSTNVRAHAGPNRSEGVGISEAPRGTLIHHYRVDENGLVRWANLIIATGHNNLAMNQGILQAAKKFVKGDKIPEGALNRVEAVIRCYDPCLSCSTHALGQMPLTLELRDATGRLRHQVSR
jgi:NAD-reducing hydrogenase large subunit